MSYELLQRTVTAALPMTIAHPADINMLRAYVAARLVQADIPAPVRTGHLFLQPAATLHAVTQLGHQALATSVVTMAQARPRPQPQQHREWAGAGQPA